MSNDIVVVFSIDWRYVGRKFTESKINKKKVEIVCNSVPYCLDIIVKLSRSLKSVVVFFSDINFPLIEIVAKISQNSLWNLTAILPPKGRWKFKEIS